MEFLQALSSSVVCICEAQVRNIQVRLKAKTNPTHGCSMREICVPPRTTAIHNSQGDQIPRPVSIRYKIGEAVDPVHQAFAKGITHDVAVRQYFVGRRFCSIVHRKRSPT